MANEPIEVNAELIASQVDKLVAYYPRTPGRDLFEELYDLWDKAGMPKEFQAETAKTIREALRMMDNTIELAKTAAAAMVARREGASEAEKQALEDIQEMLVILESNREVFLASPPVSWNNPDSVGPPGVPLA